MDKIMCDCGCGDNATVFCDDACYCDDCFSELIGKHLQEVTGWRPCGHLVYGGEGRAPCICLERHGTEHSHGRVSGY